MQDEGHQITHITRHSHSQPGPRAAIPTLTLRCPATRGQQGSGAGQRRLVEVGRDQRRSVEVGRRHQRSVEVGRLQRRSVEFGRDQQRSVEVGRHQRRSVEVGRDQRRSVEVGRVARAAKGRDTSGSSRQTAPGAATTA